MISDLKTKNVTNILLSNWSMQPVWAGTSLLFMHLRAMKDLLKMRSSNQWNWDYIINLSEADFPIR